MNQLEYIDCLLYRNGEEIKWFIQEMTEIVDVEKLNVTSFSLPMLLQAFYQRIGYRNVYTDKVIKDLGQDDTILYAIYECLPLVTYVNKYFKCPVKEHPFSRDQLILYAYIRLRENSPAAFSFFEKDDIPPHPFKNEIMTRNYNIPSVTELLSLYEGDANNLLIHLIIMTALSANYTKEEDEEANEKRAQFFQTLNEELDSYNAYNFQHSTPLKYNRYPLLDNVCVNLNWSTSIGRGGKLERKYGVETRYPESWVDDARKCFEIIHKMKNKLDLNRQLWLNGAAIQDIKDTNIRRYTYEDDPLPIEMGFINPPHFLVCNKYFYFNLNNPSAAYNISVERYLFKLIATLLPMEDAPLNTYQGLRMVNINKTIYAEVAYDGWFVPKEWSSKIVSDILSNPENLKSFVTTCIIILSFNLKTSYYRDTPNTGFYNTRKFIAYVPNNITFDDYVNNVYRINDKINYYGMLLGNNYSKSENTEDSFLPYGPIRAAWIAAGDCRRQMAIYCNKILQLIYANADVFYDICGVQSIKYGQMIECKKDFMTRVEGLYAASKELILETVNM